MTVETEDKPAALTLRRKVFLSLIGLCALACAALGLLANMQAKEALQSAATQRLFMINSEAQSSAAAEIEKVLGDLSALAGDPSVGSELQSMVTTLESDMDKGLYATFHNPALSDEERAAYDGTGAKLVYAFKHAKFHARPLSIWQKTQSGDILMVDLDGQVVYSVTKGPDFLQTIDEIGSKALASVVAQAGKAGQGEIAFADFAPYAPAGGAPSAFFAAPGFRADALGNTSLSHVVVYRLPVARFASMFADSHQDVSMAFIGPEGTFRLAFDPTDQNKAAPAALASAMEAEPGGTVVGDVTGLGEALITFAPLDLLGNRFTIASASPLDVVMAPVAAMRNSLLLMTVVIIVIAGLAAIILGRGISGPIDRITSAMRRLAGGDLEIELGDKIRHDEIGDMARAVEVFRENALKAQALEAANRQAAQEAEAARRAMITELRQSFGVVVDAAVKGDFSRRVHAAFHDPELQAMCEGINQLCSTVQHATNELADMLQAVADGDLTRRVVTTYEGVFGVLKNSINHTSQRLCDIVVVIQDLGRDINLAISEISAGADDLAHRTELSASSIEETAASTEEMAATVKLNASNAENAHQLAQTANRVAESSGKIVSDAVGAMGQIEESGRQIANIISVIDEIAFQTNLLALNASVEAARAGEAGKGFAVVAQEVRGLAQRSATASGDIKTLINASSGQIGKGVDLVNRTGDALREILESIRQLSSIVGQISGASREQASGIEELNSAVSDFDDMTQRTSSLVEQSTASTRHLGLQAEKLLETMAFFRISDRAKGNELVSRPMETVD